MSMNPPTLVPVNTPPRSGASSPPPATNTSYNSLPTAAEAFYTPQSVSTAQGHAAVAPVSSSSILFSSPQIVPQVTPISTTIQVCLYILSVDVSIS